ncbi:secondary thiamine-phosphate synthase enzyme YjbQ [Aeoliella mucimassa]|nr:secondary thiamine-phosphate synthase enzyme YjbQ [Aeoliella mucimassa]
MARLYSILAKDAPMVFQERFKLETSGHRDMQDISSRVSEIIQRSSIQTGTAHIFNVGSTGVIAAIEFEPGLAGDLPAILDQLIPPSTSYGHERAWNDGNGHSHLQSTWLGPELTIPVENGRPVLGTWQQVIHLECDIKPRSRSVVVTVHGE